VTTKSPSSKFEELGKGIVKRKQQRVLGLFIDGTGLDRATRRINRKVDMSNLIKGVTSGITPAVARYYTLIPYEDDSRQRAFLDAVDRAGLHVVVKRLPPKGINRQVSVDIEMAADIVAFSLGHREFSDLSQYKASDSDGSTLKPYQGSAIPTALPFSRQRKEEPQTEKKNDSQNAAKKTEDKKPAAQLPKRSANEERIVTVVCPGRDLCYPIALVRELGIDTITADFGQFNSGDILKAAAKWIDLSDSETIWRE
jgi:uncharacterized LabA/DUF88 family protein